jgi:hypothetical protein
MMPERQPEKDPGHLDIDAVSAFVDRDFEPEELATIEFHLTRCPACEREVLEIRTTVVLLGRLPQYEPRRSFCLGQEHARATRRRGRHQGALTGLAPQLPASHLAAQEIPSSVPSSRFMGWLPALHAAALVTGVLLLLVTVGDLTGIARPEQAAVQLVAPTAAAGIPTMTATVEPTLAAMPAPESASLQAPAAAPAAPDGETESPPEGIASFQEPAEDTVGTNRADGASEGVPEQAEMARTAPRLAATGVAVAAVTRAMPTPSAAKAPTGGAASDSGTTEPTANEASPSRLRIAQLALGLILAWLVVSIVGLRWVRRVG